MVGPLTCYLTDVVSAAAGVFVQRLLIFASLFAPQVAAACEFPSSNNDLLQSLDAAVVAFSALEVEAFNTAQGEATHHLDCLAEPLSRNTAAQFHRVAGLAWFLNRENSKAAASFAAARHIEPAYIFPVDLIPTGNPILQTYTSLDPKTSPTEAVPAPSDGSMTIDGSSVLVRRSAHPAIVQQLSAQGSVVDTVLLAPGDPMPTMMVAPEPTEPPTAAKTKARSPRTALLIAAGSSLAVSGGLYAGGAATRSGWSNAGSVEEANTARATTNALVIGSGVAGVLGLGLGAGGLLVSGRR